MATTYGPRRARKTFVLCFDGTGNKFSGTDGDSNIIKIYRMLDRGDPNQLHYYQPGIGTYVETKSLSHTTLPARLNSWFQKARDSAIGSSFDTHVMGGYQFLMRYYTTGDEIYFFGFSRGAYVARFLAEMLDHVGLLSAGNEELARFAWKAFARWQQRQESTSEEKAKRDEMFEFLKGFRETFSRPVRRIRFLGLFDTVNSVPRFENAWMERSKFPYTARSSALTIRHAVGIDERRAKFRQDLLSEGKLKQEAAAETAANQQKVSSADWEFRPRNRRGAIDNAAERQTRRSTLAVTNERFRRPSKSRSMSRSPGRSSDRPAPQDKASLRSGDSQISLTPELDPDDDDDDVYESLAQDIQEVWFPGCHADIGGGWPMAKGEEVPLSHGPLVWMVRAAQQAGLQLNMNMVHQLRCHDLEFEEPFAAPEKKNPHSDRPIPQLRINSGRGEIGNLSPRHSVDNEKPGSVLSEAIGSPFRRALESGATRGKLHDCLEFKQGLPASSVISWRIMEYLPFRRMDLQPDGSWSSISWPLPKGETRDIPTTAMIHHSALQRMQADPSYRPGNLILGGGGRGVRRAPPDAGTGDWEVKHEEGDPVGEVWVRKANKQTQTNGKS